MNSVRVQCLSHVGELVECLETFEEDTTNNGGGGASTSENDGGASRTLGGVIATGFDGKGEKRREICSLN